MKIKRLLKNPYYAIYRLAGKKLAEKMPVEKFLRFQFRAHMGYWPDLRSPKTFNEKLLWLKLYDCRPEYTTMVDKHLVREYIKEKIGEEYLIPQLGAWDSPDEIDFDALPDQFVLKCNHNSGKGMYICKDKSQMDEESVKRGLTQGLQEDYFLMSKEWPYKHVPRKIVCEKFMTDGAEELADYKVHNFNGEPKMILVCRDRFAPTGLTEDFFSEKWEHFDMRRPRIPNAKKEIPKPEQLEQMLELSKILAKDIPFVRTDFYIIGGQIYFGEITFFPASGLAGFAPENWDETIGSWIKLPTQKRNGV